VGKGAWLEGERAWATVDALAEEFLSDYLSDYVGKGAWLEGERAWATVEALAEEFLSEYSQE
jgi:3-methyladenine DNA glycosylase AlkD